MLQRDTKESNIPQLFNRVGANYNNNTVLYFESRQSEIVLQKYRVIRGLHNRGSTMLYTIISLK